MSEPCVAKGHFTCDGSGRMCDLCGEAEPCCDCDDDALEDCEECDGTGIFCVTHESGMVTANKCAAVIDGVA